MSLGIAKAVEAAERAAIPGRAADDCNFCATLLRHAGAKVAMAVFPAVMSEDGRDFWRTRRAMQERGKAGRP